MTSASLNRDSTAVVIWSTTVYFRKLDHSSIFELFKLKNTKKISLSDLAFWVTICAVHQVIFEHANKIMNRKCAQIDKNFQRSNFENFHHKKSHFCDEIDSFFHTFFDNWPNELYNFSNLQGLRPDSTLWPWTCHFYYLEIILIMNMAFILSFCLNPKFEKTINWY